MQKPLAITATIASLVWLLASFDYEPIIALVTSIGWFLAVIKKESLISSNGLSGNDEDSLKEPIKTIDSAIAKKIDFSKNKPQDIVSRFIKVFLAHGIEITQIPRVIPKGHGITLYSLKDENSILKHIDDSLIGWLTNTFGIRRTWLECGGEQIYETVDFYKAVKSFIELAQQLKSKKGDFEIIAFKDVKELKNNDKRGQNVNLLIRVPLLSIDDKDIYKYHVTSTLWDWGHRRARYQFKSIARLCFHNLKVHIEGRDLPSDELLKLALGYTFPELLINKFAVRRTWYPEDTSLRPPESPQAKEQDEIESIVEYIDKQKYLHVLNEFQHNRGNSRVVESAFDL